MGEAGDFKGLRDPPGLLRGAFPLALPERVLPGQLRASRPQLHRGLNRLDALAPRSDGYMERSLEALIGFDQFCVLIRRGKRRLCHQLVLLPDAEVVIPAHRLKYSHAFSAVYARPLRRQQPLAHAARFYT
jgi:hypothetical protein